MKLLIFEWGAYTQPDITWTLKRENVSLRTVSYHFNDKNEDPFFMRRFSQYVKEAQYDAVFSVNYFPLVAQVCFENSVKYVSWSYDNPLNIHDIEKTLGYPTNFVFLFDAAQAASYRNLGFENVFHLPLAVNAQRLDTIKVSPEEYQYYHSDIAFLGKLYPSYFNEYLEPLERYDQGYLNGLCDAQLKVYGCYFLDHFLTEDRIQDLNAQYEAKLPASGFRISKEALSYAMAAQITRRERLLLLSLLSRHFQVKLYSREDNPALSRVRFMGSAGYLKEMPKIFKAADINLNITLKIIQSGIPLRVMDILGAGGFLLSNYQPELADYFENEREVVMYESVEDAYDKCRFYLSRPDLREEIARKGHERACGQFSYKNQLTAAFQAAGLAL